MSFPESINRHLQVCSLWLRKGIKNPYTAYRSMLEEFLLNVEVPINNLSENKSILLSLEGGSSFERDLNRLYLIKDDGIYSVMLTWNNANSHAGGASGDGGLTNKGVDAVRIMNELGMALDLSHLNDKSIYSAIVRADTILASHSNCRAVWQHKRNLPDDVLCLIGEKRGIIGINFYPSFLGEGDVFENIYLHIEHMLNLGLCNSIAIGSDLDGADMDKRLSKTEDIPQLYCFLENRLGADLCNKIFFKNAYNFYEKLFDKSSNM